MLIGCHIISSNPMIIPAEMRNALSGPIFITQGFEQNLILFSAEFFEQISNKFLQMSLTDPLVRMLSRLIMSSATRLEIGPTGEFNIPQNLKAYTQIQDTGILVGQGVYCELWSPEQWQLQELKLRDADANSCRFNTYQLNIA